MALTHEPIIGITDSRSVDEATFVALEAQFDPVLAELSRVTGQWVIGAKAYTQGVVVYGVDGTTVVDRRSEMTVSFSVDAPNNGLRHLLGPQFLPEGIDYEHGRVLSEESITALGQKALANEDRGIRHTRYVLPDNTPDPSVFLG